MFAPIHLRNVEIFTTEMFQIINDSPPLIMNEIFKLPDESEYI